MDATERNTSTRTPPTPAGALAVTDPPVATWVAAFLEVFRTNGNVSAACRAAKIERSTAYRAKENNASFAELWAEAEKSASDALLEEAWRRAVTGGRSYKFDKDGFPLRHPETQEPYYEEVRSDGLLMALLKARLPELFGDKLKLDATVGAKAPAYDLSKLNPEQLAQLELLTTLATVPQLPEHE